MEEIDYGEGFRSTCSIIILLCKITQVKRAVPSTAARVVDKRIAKENIRIIGNNFRHAKCTRMNAT